MLEIAKGILDLLPESIDVDFVGRSLIVSGLSLHHNQLLEVADFL